ncbi:CGNR zinc finger domain-containing protein [Kribbella sp. NPDC026611]|uniref:CGNR zinc finger domain-containing protein n=1 Tax=Kribbella sp. NPDC026611 TaxID=3154911 RepID=UPI0033DDD612
MEGLQARSRMIQLTVGLVNTNSLEPERLTSPAELSKFFTGHGEPAATVTWRDVTEVKLVRERIRPIFNASAAEAAGIINGLLAQYATVPYLSEGGVGAWHLHTFQPDAALADRLAASCALALAGFATEHGFGAIATCAAPNCERVFVNAARNRPRRFCSPPCSTRTRVASYRARQRR